MVLIPATVIISSCAKDIIDTTGSIVGLIKDYQSGEMVKNVSVSLMPGGSSVVTNEDGSFEFNDLQPGEYELLCTKFGYNDLTQSTSVVAGQTSKVSIILKSKSAFALSENQYNFGDLEISRDFYFFNNSDADCSFEISNIPKWVSFSKERGSVPADGNTMVTAIVDRSKVDEGDYSQNIGISFSGKSSGTEVLTLKMQKVRLTTPTVTISSRAEHIKENSFDITGQITATGGSAILSYGHCWSTTQNPTVNDAKTDLGGTSSLGPFTSSVESLAAYTQYYVRAYARNAQGISYSESISVTTQDTESDKWDGSPASSFSGGDGSSYNPYIIKTGGELLLMKDYSDKCFKIANNIDLDNHNWLPFQFDGSLDGDGHTVSNLLIDRDSDNQGLFGLLKGDVVNLKIFGVKIPNGKGNAGALAGTIESGFSTVENCSVILGQDSKIIGKNAGGITGFIGSDAGSVSLLSCSVSSSTGKELICGDNAGGIIGYSYGTLELEISDCHVSINIQGTDNAGGIIGSCATTNYEYNDMISITASSFKGNMAGKTTGGIIGYNTLQKCSVSESKSDFTITSSGGNSGGIIGYCRLESGKIQIIASYAKGTIEGSCASDCYFGGLYGQSWGGQDTRQVKPEIILSYSTVTSSRTSFYPIGRYHTPSNEYPSVYTHSDITAIIRDSYSQYTSKFNCSDPWTWAGSIDSKQKSVSCPKLAWE